MDERNEYPTPEENTTDVAETLSQFFGTAKEVVDRYTHCSFCGANLHFTHITDFSRNLTQETARCPECGDRARRVVHKLQ